MAKQRRQREDSTNRYRLDSAATRIVLQVLYAAYSFSIFSSGARTMAQTHELVPCALIRPSSLFVHADDLGRVLYRLRKVVVRVFREVRHNPHCHLGRRMSKSVDASGCLGSKQACVLLKLLMRVRSQRPCKFGNEKSQASLLSIVYSALAQRSTMMCRNQFANLIACSWLTTPSRPLQ